VKTLGYQNLPWLVGTLVYGGVQKEEKSGLNQFLIHKHFSPHPQIPQASNCPSSNQEPKEKYS